MPARLPAIAIGLAIAVAPLLASPLGRLGPPFALLVVLPALALALEAFGWSRELAAALRRIVDPTRRLVAAYGVWLAVSALLSLDTAATAGATVGLDIAGTDPEERERHVGAAILGSNVGSLLFPFSNLTNLIVVGAAGVGLMPYVEATWIPQLVAALGVAWLLSIRTRPGRDNLEPEARALAGEPRPVDGAGTGAATPVASLGRATKRPRHDLARAPVPLAGATALIGSAGAIVCGVAGFDMAVPFALTGGLLTAAALLQRRVTVRDVGRTLPLTALAFVVAAALLTEPAATAVRDLPRPDAGLGGLLLAAAVGGLLSISVNNLPAAAVGAVWLGHGSVPLVVAYLVGTNIVAVATPHGSAATMLARSVGARRGATLTWRTYVRGAWRYSLIGAGVAIAALAVTTHAG